MKFKGIPPTLIKDSSFLRCQWDHVQSFAHDINLAIQQLSLRLRSFWWNPIGVFSRAPNCDHFAYETNNLSGVTKMFPWLHKCTENSAACICIWSSCVASLSHLQSLQAHLQDLGWPRPHLLTPERGGKCLTVMTYVFPPWTTNTKRIIVIFQDQIRSSRGFSVSESFLHTPADLTSLYTTLVISK